MEYSKSESRHSGSISEKVIERVAKAEGVSPVALDTSLYETIDPDALDRLFERTAGNNRMEGTVVFPFQGYDVSVTGEGHVIVEERESDMGDGGASAQQSFDE